MRCVIRQLHTLQSATNQAFQIQLSFLLLREHVTWSKTLLHNITETICVTAYDNRWYWDLHGVIKLLGLSRNPSALPRKANDQSEYSFSATQLIVALMTLIEALIERFRIPVYLVKDRREVSSREASYKRKSPLFCYLFRYACCSW